MTSLDLLNARRSVPAKQLRDPGPDEAQLAALLDAAIRAPDHGKLTPWRLLLIRGAERARLAEQFAAIQQRTQPDVSPKALEKTRERFGDGAPLIITVIAAIDPGHAKIPAQEQLLSTGCVAYNLLIGAQALGFGAQWLTGWAAYEREVAIAMGLSTHESIIAFIHVGTPENLAPERTRPAREEIVSDWRA